MSKCVLQGGNLLTDTRCALLSLCLGLWLILELYSLALADTALHLLDKLLLLTFQFFKLDLHTMDFLLHLCHLYLSYVRVNCLLHLLLELGFTLPEQDLSLSFHDLTKNNCFVVL